MPTVPWVDYLLDMYVAPDVETVQALRVTCKALRHMPHPMDAETGKVKKASDPGLTPILCYIDAMMKSNYFAWWLVERISKALIVRNADRTLCILLHHIPSDWFIRGSVVRDIITFGAARGNIQILKWCVSYKTALDARLKSDEIDDNERNKLLHRNFRYDPKFIYAAIDNGRVEVIRLTLEYGIAPCIAERPKVWMRTAIRAASKAQYDILDLLITKFSEPRGWRRLCNQPAEEVVFEILRVRACNDDRSIDLLYDMLASTNKLYDCIKRNERRWVQYAARSGSVELLRLWLGTQKQTVKLGKVAEKRWIWIFQNIEFDCHNCKEVCDWTIGELEARGWKEQVLRKVVLADGIHQCVVVYTRSKMGGPRRAS